MKLLGEELNLTSISELLAIQIGAGSDSATASDWNPALIRSDCLTDWSAFLVWFWWADTSDWNPSHLHRRSDEAFVGHQREMSWISVSSSYSFWDRWIWLQRASFDDMRRKWSCPLTGESNGREAIESGTRFRRSTLVIIYLIVVARRLKGSFTGRRILWLAWPGQTWSKAMINEKVKLDPSWNTDQGV